MQLPESTIVNRFVPKEKFYSKTSVVGKLKQQFTDEIEKITWVNKIAPDTLNITSKDYAELQVFEIILKQSELSTAILKHIDTFIPYPILFILKKDGAERAVISFKESGIKNENQMKVDSYYETPWRQELHLELKGRSVDEIYRNFLFQITPDLQSQGYTSTKVAVEANKEQLKLQKQIDVLNKQIANEPSTAKRQELARERHDLQKGMLKDASQTS
ncbi:MAG: DUF4391 domain-containing protein [Candidatus Saccharimonadota bacterium]